MKRIERKARNILGSAHNNNQKGNPLKNNDSKM